MYPEKSVEYISSERFCRYIALCNQATSQTNCSTVCSFFLFTFPNTFPPFSPAPYDPWFEMKSGINSQIQPATIVKWKWKTNLQLWQFHGKQIDKNPNDAKTSICPLKKINLKNRFSWDFRLRNTHWLQILQIRCEILGIGLSLIYLKVSVFN